MNYNSFWLNIGRYNRPLPNMGINPTNQFLEPPRWSDEQDVSRFVQIITLF
jgi:hypothetical protein